MMEIKLTEELSAGEIGDLVASKFPGFNLDVDWRSSAKATKSVFPSAIVPGSLLREGKDGSEIWVVPTDEELKLENRERGRWGADEHPANAPFDYVVVRNIYDPETWCYAEVRNLTVIGWMDPTK